MRLHFPWKTNNGNDRARHVPQSVKVYMVHRFLLLPEYVDMLRCFEYPEMMNNNKPIRRFSIFSPHKAQELHLSIKTLADLLNHREVLEYEGHIEADGTVYVADRRLPRVLERKLEKKAVASAMASTDRISKN